MRGKSAAALSEEEAVAAASGPAAVVAADSAAVLIATTAGTVAASGGSSEPPARLPLSSPQDSLWRAPLADYIELTKPRIALMVVMIASASYFLGVQQTTGEGGEVVTTFDYLRLLHMVAGTWLLASGVAALNQYLERDIDGLMRRTAKRPLPAGRLSPNAALIFGTALVIGAEVYLWWCVNGVTAVVGAAVVAGYVGLYTPLKRRTLFATAIGAVPGALPPVVGWAAARGELGAGAWVLFGVLFLWQFPHFLAIAWMYREEYGRAGMRMLAVEDTSGIRTAQQIMITLAALMMISVYGPVWVGIGGQWYMYGALALGAAYTWAGVQMARERTRANARRLLLVSVIYLPLLFMLMLIGK